MKKLAIAGLVSATIVGIASFSIAGQKINDKDLLNQARNYFQPLPKQIPAPSDNPTTKEKVELGKKLYYDPRLSLSGVISCNTCHNLATYGVDGVETSLGHKFQTGGKNAPTVLNAGFHIVQFWDGRALYDLPHGACLSIVIPAWMWWYKDKNRKQFDRFAKEVFNLPTAEEGIKALKNWFSKVEAPVSLQDGKIPSSDIDKIANHVYNTTAKLWGLDKIYTVDKIKEILYLASRSNSL